MGTATSLGTVPRKLSQNRHSWPHAIHALHSVPSEAIWEVEVAVGFRDRFRAQSHVENLSVIDVTCLQVR